MSSSEPSAVRVLVCGPIRGRFKTIVKRLNSIIRKSTAGSFDVLFALGEFFGDSKEAEAEWAALEAGDIQFPLPTIVFGPTSMNQDLSSMETPTLCHNVEYLGCRGIYLHSSGLRFAYVSGDDLNNVPNSDENDKELLKKFHFTEDDVTNFIDSHVDARAGIDLLFSSQWPWDVERNGVKVAVPESELDRSSDNLLTGDGHSGQSRLLSRLSYSLRPRYHFAAGRPNVFYERLPYRNHRVGSEAKLHVTRFIGLADVGNSAKQQYLYAFHRLSHDQLVLEPAGSTDNPWGNVDLTKEYETWKSVGLSSGASSTAKSLDKTDSGQYFWKLGRKRPAPPTDKNQFNPYANLNKKPHGECWFCLASQHVERHLVVSVGEHTYVALAKGGVVPEHTLILPIGHYQSLRQCPSEVLEEIEEYKSALERFYVEHLNRTAVFFERNFKQNHVQVQCVPIPASSGSLAKQAFMDLANRYHIKLQELPKHSDLTQIVKPGQPYFLAELSTGERLFLRILGAMPLQFGREVVCGPSLLDMRDRIDWRKCALSEAEETAAANDFKRQFADYDFTRK